MTKLIGRENEIETLNSLLISDESELVSVIGRRRVGKTFLIESVYAQQIAFKIMGIQKATTREQLDHFSLALTEQSQSLLPAPRFKSWLEAFSALIIYLKRTATDDKRVIFFDEMPWLETHRSKFLNAFGYFWNSWAVTNNVVVVICGSAASWMIQKVVHNKGDLYNRITKRINLRPFSLHETELYLQSKGFNFNRYQITELYMALGGIPHYLKEIKKGDSVAQNIDRICFNPDGILFDEFEQLYPSLFEYSENHIEVVSTLAIKPSGMTREEIIKNSPLSNGGGLSKTIEELSYSGFITEYQPFDRIKKEKLYRLTDEYSLFYLKFIKKMKQEGANTWQSFEQTPNYRTWSGYAFESICLKHIPEIKKALGISGIFSSTSTFYHKGAEGMAGCQVDLLIDRNDKVINLFEIKWANAEFVITKDYAKELRMKMTLFKHYSKTKKQVFFSFMSTYGVVKNENWGMIDKELTLDILFVSNA